MRTIALLPFAALLACGPHATSVPAAAQTGSFTISRHGDAVGTASFSFKGTPQGYNSTSLVSVTMVGLTYAISKNEKLSSANQLQHVQLSATVNGSAVSVTAMPDAAQMLMNISANGHSSTTRLPAHPAAVFLPDFDPGALETLLALAVTHNNRDLWAIIPKKAGSVEPVELATYADQRGTLDGKPTPGHAVPVTPLTDTQRRGRSIN